MGLLLNNMSNMIDKSDVSEILPLNRAAYRNDSHDQSFPLLSAGFIDKSDWPCDVIEERYNRFVMVFLISGSGHYEDSFGISYRLGAGDVFFRCPDRVHSTLLDVEASWQEAFVGVRSSWFQTLLDMGLIGLGSPCFHIDSASELLYEVNDILDTLPFADTLSEITQIEFRMVELMRRTLLRNPLIQPSRLSQAELLEKARLLIHENAFIQGGIEPIFDDISISYSRLRTLFKEAYGTSPGIYRIQVRLNRACALLDTTSLPISEISEVLGYADAFSFSKQFKQRIGVTPSRYRGRESRPNTPSRIETQHDKY